MTDFFDRISSLSPKRLALLAHELNEKLIREQAKTHQPIAIVGLAFRLPGAGGDPETLWRHLLAGDDLTGPAPSDRWRLDQPVAGLEGAAGAEGGPRGGYLRRIDEFDPLFFGISPREAETMDPQQRLLLEVAWEALENAAIAPSSLRGSRAGVFAGIAGGDFARRILDQDSAELDSHMASGGSNAIAAGRISYTLGLEGPCVSMDTACSSSLVAIGAACDSLRLGRSDLALAGGVSLMLSPEITIVLAKAGMLSPGFRCKSFDAGADGFVRGEGCGVFVLKRLADAERDRDRIAAVIRGTAVNQDGRSSGLTAPSGPAQRSLLRDALADAGLDAAQVRHVEAHGTGTNLGDPIEAQALAAVFGDTRPPDSKLWLGSIKANFGHLEAAAGAAGLIKLVLSLEHGIIPPLAGLTTPNPHIDWDGTCLALPTRPMPWPGAPCDRVGGVSSFGFSGTNAHLVVSGPPPAAAPRLSEPDRRAHLLCLSAKSPSALRALASRHVDYLDRHPDVALSDFCHTANAGRDHHAERLAIVCQDIPQARARLAAAASGPPTPEARRTQAPGIAFLFTGQGSQYPRMARALYDREPAFAATIDRCDEILAAVWGHGLKAILFSDAGGGRLDQTGYTQPALFAVEVALAELLISWGIRPGAVMGHSVGEYAAACVAGIFTLEDGLRLIAARARLMQSLPPGGGMVAVLAGEAEVARAIAPFPTLAVAALNGPANIVVSGPLADIGRLTRSLDSSGAIYQQLTVSHAFHSALLDPILGALEREADSVRHAEPAIPIVSNLTGRRLQVGELRGGAYWRAHAREPVRFADGMRALRALDCGVFIEIGPAPTLLGMARRVLASPDIAWLPTLKPGLGDLDQLLESVGKLYQGGVDLDFAAMARPHAHRKLSIPTYPFEKSRYWPRIKPRATNAAPTRDAHVDWLYDLEWRPSPGDIPSPGDDPAQASHRDAGGRWLILADRGGLGRDLAARLRARGGECLIVHPGDAYRDRGGDIEIRPLVVADHARVLETFVRSDPRVCRGVVYLWGLDAVFRDEDEPAAVLGSVEAACRPGLVAIQAMATIGWRGGGLTVATRGGRSTERMRTPANPAQAALWGMVGAASLEHPELGCRRVDLSGADEARRLLDELLRDDRVENQVALTPNGRRVLRLRRSPAGEGGAAPPRPRGDAAYIVTGGLTGLGLETARWLAERGAGQLILVGRRAPDETARATLARIGGAGNAPICLSADVGDARDADRIFAAADGTGLELAGVVHAAGIISDASLLHQDWPRFEAVLRAKAAGAWNLHRLTRSRALDFFVLYSSGAAIMGSAGQANYAAANAFMDSLAFHRSAQGLPALSINWAAWRDIGVAAGHPALEMTRRRGVDPIDIAGGLTALGRMMASRSVQTAVLPIDWSRLGGLAWPILDEIRPPPRLDQPGGSRPSEEEAKLPGSGDWRKMLDGGVPALRKSMLRGLLEEDAARLLKLSSVHLIDPGQPLRELGMDSLVSLEFRNRISVALGVELPPTLLYNYPNIDMLTEHLLHALSAAAPATESERAVDPDDLSEEDLARLLEEQINLA